MRSHTECCVSKIFLLKWEPTGQLGKICIKCLKGIILFGVYRDI